MNPQGALPRSFFDRPAPELAQRLLGCRLVSRGVTLRITEVEAYLGADDPGSHAYRGPSKRNATMFGDPGHLYVYRHMGLHSCCNIVGSDARTANAVLLRAGEVVDGVDLARQRRAEKGRTRTDVDLAQGPGRLTMALGISWPDDDGLDLCADGLHVLDRDHEPKVRHGPRIGLRPEATEPAHLHLRFWIPGDPTVSGPRSAART